MLRILRHPFVLLAFGVLVGVAAGYQPVEGQGATVKVSIADNGTPASSLKLGLTLQIGDINCPNGLSLYAKAESFCAPLFAASQTLVLNPGFPYQKPYDLYDDNSTVAARFIPSYT